ncbi:MAG: pantetheine-phosphate adenylyltransferase [Pseudomonadota bacterium]
MAKTAFYPGSFDPVTNGHMDVLAQSLILADRVVVGIGVHPGKSPLFSLGARREMLLSALSPEDQARTTVVAFDTLVVEAAAAHGATILVRGLRDGTDLDYEMQMAGMNRTLAPGIGTVFVPASPGVRHITATLVRQIAKMGGAVDAFVPPHVAAAFAARVGR